MDRVRDFWIVVSRPHVFANAFHEVWASVSPGIHRACGVSDDDFDRTTITVCRDLFEVTTRPGHSATGACTDHHVGNLPGGIVPDFRAGRLIGRFGGSGVEELARLVGALDSV